MLARAEVETSLKRIGHAVRDTLERCVEACFDCAKACAGTGDGIGEPVAAVLTKCSRVCLDCAQACAAACSRTAAAIEPAAVRQALEDCIAACRACLPYLSGDGAARCRVCVDRCSATLLQLA